MASESREPETTTKMKGDEMTTATKTYRVYETMAGVGALNTGSEYIEAASAQEAAEEAAEERRGNPECEGYVMVATDDNGDSAEAAV